MIDIGKFLRKRRGKKALRVAFSTQGMETRESHAYLVCAEWYDTGNITSHVLAGHGNALSAYKAFTLDNEGVNRRYSVVNIVMLG